MGSEVGETFVIVGTGGLARELTSWIVRNRHSVHGYVTTAPYEHSKFGLPGVILQEDDAVPLPVLLGIGSPTEKRSAFSRLAEKGWRFGTFVDVTAVLGSGVRMREGAVVSPGCVISTNVELGVCSYVNFQCGIGHDATIGDFVQVNPGSQIGGNCTIGSEVLIGSGSTIIEKTDIADRAMIGSGSVIYTRVRSGAHMIARPSKRMRALES